MTDGHPDELSRRQQNQGNTFPTQVYDVVRQLDWPPEYNERALGNSFLDAWHDNEAQLSALLPQVVDIFQKAVESSQDYDDLFKEWAPRGASAGDVFEALAIRDIGDAARTFRPVWEQTKHRDGYCSIEVTPTLAHDTKGTVVGIDSSAFASPRCHHWPCS